MVDRTVDNNLPIICPDCLDEKYKFYSIDGVDKHFEVSHNHDSNPEQIKQQIKDAKNTETDSKQLPNEANIIELWANTNFHEFNYCKEVPVQVSTLNSNSKRIDVVLFETWPFRSESEYLREANRQGAFNRMSGGFKSKQDQVEFILSNTRDPARVSIYEAKRELDFKSIGQILSYSEFFSEYYSSCGDIRVVERGIIYGDGDVMCRETAERYGISLYPVDWE